MLFYIRTTGGLSPPVLLISRRAAAPYYPMSLDETLPAKLTFKMYNVLLTVDNI